MYLRDSLLHTCTCTHTHAHTRTHACTHARTHARTHAHTHTHSDTHTCKHACMNTQLHIHTHTHIHTYTSVLAYTHTSVLAYTHTHTHTHLYSHTHTHTCTDCQRKSYTLVFQIYGGVKYGREACTAGWSLFQFQGLARLLAGNGVGLCRPGSAACARWKSQSAADVQTVSGNSQMRPAPLDLLSDEERLMRDAGKCGCGETKEWLRVNSL